MPNKSKFSPKFKRGLGHISYLTVANIFSALISLVAMIYIPNRLGVKNYGYYITAGSFVGLFNIISFSGLTKVILREASRDVNLFKKHLHALFSLKLVLAVFEIFVILTVLYFVRKYDTKLKILIIITAINVIPNSLISIPHAIIQAYEQFKIFSILNVLKSFLRTAGLICILLITTNLKVVLVFLLVLNSVFAVIYYLTIDKKNGIKFPLYYIREKIPPRYIKEALVFTLIGVAGTLTLKMDVAMLSWMATPEEVGIYGLAEKIVSKIASVRGIVLTAFFPIFIKKYKNHKVNIGQLYKYSAAIFLGMLSIAILLSISSKYFIQTIFNNEYQQSAIVFSALIFYLVFYFANLPFSTALQSVGLEKVFLFHYLFTPFINIGLNYYFYRLFGVIGFAYSSVIVQIFILAFISILGSVFMKKEYLFFDNHTIRKNMAKSLKHRTFTGILWSASEAFSIQGLRFALGLVLARLLVPADYGLIGMLSIFLAISESFINSGFSSALVQKKDRTDVDYSTVFWFNLLVSSFFYILFIIAAPYIAKFYNQPALTLLTRIISINIVISALTIVQRTKLRISLDFKTQAKASMISVFVGGIVGIVLAYQGFGVWALVIQSITKNIINTFTLWYYSKWIPTKVFSKKSLKTMFSYGSKLLGAGLLNTIFKNIYQLIIGKFFNASSLGYYSRARQFQQLPSQNITGIIQRVTFPVLCEVQDDDARLSSAYKKFIKLSAFIIFPLMIGMLAISEPMIRLILTEKWIQSVPLLQLLCISGMLYPIHSINLNILKVKGRSDLFLKLEIIKKILIVIVILITFSFGIKALVLGQIFTSFFALFINTHYTKKIINYGMLKQLSDLFPIALITMIMFLSITAINWCIPSDFLKLIIGIIVGSAVYFLCSVIGKFEEYYEIKIYYSRKTNVTNKKIFVTQPAIPELSEFLPYLEKIWQTKCLTNNGEFHKKFEEELKSFLNVNQVNLFTNGTLALVTALQALRISGEVITTPFTFVATTHALHWNGIKPVFCDIESDSFNINPEKIEALITPKTTAIMPVHVYGNPCKVEAIQKIADTYGLKVIYDAAHAFNVTYKNESILNWGDLSILSFHATKVFNTIEGGAIVCNDAKLKEKIDYLKNFGFAGETKVIAPGINAKMNEVQAALGLLQLQKVNSYIQKRKVITKQYRLRLKNISGIKILHDFDNIGHNYSYFPILINQNEYGISRDDLYEKLKSKDIFTRRYFFPLTSQFSTYNGLDSAHPDNLPVATKIANEVICLPIYPDLSTEDVERIINLIVV